jgi:hypothetical protein
MINTGARFAGRARGTLALHGGFPERPDPIGCRLDAVRMSAFRHPFGDGLPVRQRAE